MHKLSKHKCSSTCIQTHTYAHKHTQLAWSSDSRCFLVVGNGFSSSVVMYSVSQSSGKYALKLLWQVKTESDSAVEENEGQTKGASSGESSEGGPASQKSGKDYHYGNAFTMAEINPSGSVFAVEERKNGKVFVHLFSNGGKHLKCVDFDYESVVLLSTYHSGLGVYGMVIQGGHVIVLCAESLEMKSTFKVVSGVVGGTGKIGCMYELLYRFYCFVLLVQNFQVCVLHVPPSPHTIRGMYLDLVCGMERV